MEPNELEFSDHALICINGPMKIQQIYKIKI